MDDRRFDEISKFLGTSVSRQSVFKLLAGIGAAGVSALGGAELLEARKRKKKGHNRKKDNDNDKDRDKAKDQDNNAEAERKKKRKGKGGKGKKNKRKGRNNKNVGVQQDPQDCTAADKTLICHEAGGSGNFTTNCVDESAACGQNGHGGHAGDCVCASSQINCPEGIIPTCASINVACDLAPEDCTGCDDGETVCGTVCCPVGETCTDPQTSTCAGPTTTTPPPTTTTPPPTTTTSPLVCAGTCSVGGAEPIRCPDLENCRCKLTAGAPGQCVACPPSQICGPVCCPEGEECIDPQSGTCRPPVTTTTPPPTTTTPPPTTTTPPPTTTTPPPTTTTPPPTTTTAPPTTTTAPPTTTTAPPTTTTAPPVVCAGPCSVTDPCPALTNCLCELNGAGPAGTCVTCPDTRVTCGPVCCPQGQICTDAATGTCAPPGCVPDPIEQACAGLACGPASNGCGVDYECGLCGKKKGKKGQRGRKQICVTGVCKATGKKRCIGSGLAGQPCSGKCKCDGDRRCNNGRCCEQRGDGTQHCQANNDCCPGLVCARRRPGQHKVCIRRNAKGEGDFTGIEETSTPGLAIGALLTGLALKGGERWFGTAGANAPIALQELGSQGERPDA